jgi:glycosyltransferase involved in cell wall biosynthesis
MDTSAIRVLHIDSEKSWRGGQQQAAYLLERMHAKGYDTAMACRHGSAMARYCREKNLPVFPLAMKGEIDFVAGYRIGALCRKKGFNILHLHSSHALATGLWASLFNPGLRLIAVRRVDFPIKKNRFSRFKYTTAKLDKIVCISEAIRKVLLRDGIPPDRLRTIHSGVDLNKFDGVLPPADFRRSLGIPDDHLLVGTVAAIAGHKDYPNLLQAAKTVIEQRENVSFCAVGDGPDENEVLALKDRLGLGDRFVFTGFRKDVGHFLKSFDVFVLASYLEGLGTSILDAQGVGLPVVACETGGIPEVVKDGVNGLLVPPRDSEALARAILALVDDKDLRRACGQTARETVQDYSIERTVEKNLALYREILDEGLTSGSATAP